jgi:hypothetical protein
MVNYCIAPELLSLAESKHANVRELVRDLTNDVAQENRPGVRSCEFADSFVYAIHQH